MFIGLTFGFSSFRGINYVIINYFGLISEFAPQISDWWIIFSSYIKFNYDNICECCSVILSTLISEVGKNHYPLGEIIFLIMVVYIVILYLVYPGTSIGKSGRV